MRNGNHTYESSSSKHSVVTIKLTNSILHMVKSELGIDYFSMPEYKIVLVKIDKDTFENPELIVEE